MNNLTKISIITLLTLFISNCGGKVREEITERYEDGNKKTIMKFKGSGSEKVMVEKVSYSQNGDTLIWEKPLDKMKMVREYFFNGQIWKEVNYKGGKEDGRYTDYDEYGQIRNERNYKDGEKDGKWTVYYENGQIGSEGNYKDGKKDGKWTGYHENGQIQVVGNYKEGKLEGKRTYYNEDGSINGVKEYKDGKLIN